MDFAALMAAELGKAKSSTASTPASPVAPSQKKYTKQSEIETRRRAQYEADQQALAAARDAKAAAKRRREEDQEAEDQAREEKRRRLAEESRRRREERDAEEERARRRHLGLPEQPTPPLPTLPDDDGHAADRAREGEGADADAPDDDELVRQLRELGEPAVLFGETRAGRVARLRRVTKALAAGPAAESAAGPIPTTLALVSERDMRIASGPIPPAGDRDARTWLFRQLVSYFSMVLREYQRTMDAEQRSDTTASRAAHSAMEQCRENMRPLFRRFERGDLADTLLEPIVDIVRAAQERRYVDANDGYLRVSIGKAAWPIGVTMVGIHERSAREKLHGGERGHVMGDEVTRKFLQSIKRCLTYAQVRWPPEDVGQLMG